MRARRGAARPTRAWVLRFLVRDRRRREKLRRPFDRREGLERRRASRRTHLTPMRQHPWPMLSFPARRRVGERTQLRTVTDGSPCRSTRTARVSVSSRPEKRVRARCRDDWRSPGVTTARSMRRRSRTSWTIRLVQRGHARVRELSDPASRVFIIIPSIVYFFTPVTPRTQRFFPTQCVGSLNLSEFLELILESSARE